MKKRILILHTELSGYFVCCVEALKREYSLDIKVVHWPTAVSAPYKHSLDHVEMIERESLEKRAKIEDLTGWKPEAVLVSGWNDALYREVAGRLKKLGAIVICGLDNPWKGNLRQWLACLVAPWVLGRVYTHIWIAGSRQREFARRLGWPSERIIPGLYSANVELFGGGEVNTAVRRLVYVGRLEPIKGVDLLCEAFSMLTDDEKNGWILQIIGNGSMAMELSSTGDLEVTAFCQPEDLALMLPRIGGFILPSRYEPWGVVVHEFASAGKPILVSSAVNAGEEFVIPGYNGLVFQSDNLQSLRQALVHFFSLSDRHRQIMGERSRELSRRNTPSLWAARLMSQIK